MSALARPPGPAVRLNDVSIRRGPNTVVEGLDLRIEPGRIFWVTGPNGAGKSSLLRVLAGLDRPSRGTVERWPPGERLRYFHSEMRLPPSAHVADWQRLVQRLDGQGEPRGDRATAVWPDVGPRRSAGRLSTGEGKRLLLDVVLRGPGSLILDEPFEHLSPDAKGSLRKLLAARARRRLVVVASNQETEHARRDGGLRLEAGLAAPIVPAERSP